MANFVMGIISISIAVVILSSVFITTVVNTNQTYACYNSTGSRLSCGWTAAEIALYGLLTIAGIAGLIYGVLSVFGVV